MAINPRKRFGIELKDDEFSVWDLNSKYIIDSNECVSLGRATPFDGEEVYGKIISLIYGGKAI